MPYERVAISDTYGARQSLSKLHRHLTRGVCITSDEARSLHNENPASSAQPRVSELVSKSTAVKGTQWFDIQCREVCERVPYVTLLSVSASSAAPGLGAHRQ